MPDYVGNALEQRAREVLAQEYERETGHKDAEFIRLTKYRGAVTVDLAVRAIMVALCDPVHAITETNS